MKVELRWVFDGGGGVMVECWWCLGCGGGFVRTHLYVKAKSVEFN